MNDGDNWGSFANQTSNTLGYTPGKTVDQNLQKQTLKHFDETVKINNAVKNASKNGSSSNVANAVTSSYSAWQGNRWNKLISAAQNGESFQLTADELSQINDIVSKWKQGGALNGQEQLILNYFTVYGEKGDRVTGTVSYM